MPRTTIVWNISLPPSMAKEAEAIAQKEARTKSELVREALRQYLWGIHPLKIPNNRLTTA